MEYIEKLKKTLCKDFCSSISVEAVPIGYAVSTIFQDNSGDRLSFYIITNNDENFCLEDDGEYIPHLIASGIDIEKTSRANLLGAILSACNCYWDKDRNVIRTDFFDSSSLSQRSAEFLSALIRIRDLELLTRDVVRSTFREDATAMLMERIGNAANFNENSLISNNLKEFKVDLVIKPKLAEAKTAAVYFVNDTLNLVEAQLLQTTLEKDNLSNDYSVVAMIEDGEMKNINKSKFQRAVNSSVVTTIFRGDEVQSVEKIVKVMGLKS